MSGEETSYVLYVDHQGHPAPLSMSYHATASRRLASAIDRHPPSTVSEVDSAYCPQCLSFHDAHTAAMLGHCPKASCRLCPMCRSVASVSLDGTDCLYKCGLCDWDSRQCFLFTQVSLESDGSVSKESVDKACEELEEEWMIQTTQRGQAMDDQYKAMLQTLDETAKEQLKGQRSAFNWLPNAKFRRKEGPEGWSIQSLEESLDDRKKLASASLAETVGGAELQLVSLEVDQVLDESLDGKSVESLLLQGGTPATRMGDLLPLPIPLRPRKSRRCRAELAEGRPGILVKPKLNPLEGDSSLRTGHGQWWKKDSSAIQVLPRVRVLTHASDETCRVFLLKVANPTLGRIRLRLASSVYAGEPKWNDTSDTTLHLQSVLVDPVTDHYVDATLKPEAVSGLQATEVCELEPAEDSFLELGGASNVEPEDVTKWNAETTLSDSKNLPSGPQPSLKLVANKNSNAWFELVLLETSIEKDQHGAVPLALQIEVGDGSWESSLVQPEESKDSDAKDMVTFDLVIVWDRTA